MACGNEQVYGIDYESTCAAFMGMSTVKLMLALATTWGFPAQHGYISNAYVEADPGLRIYHHVPQSMELNTEILHMGIKDKQEVVLEVRKSLYGIKQAGRFWSQLLHQKREEAGFRQCISDMCIYWRRDNTDIVVVGGYADRPATLILVSTVGSTK